jgi:hypothetical protein
MVIETIVEYRLSVRPLPALALAPHLRARRLIEIGRSNYGLRCRLTDTSSWTGTEYLLVVRSMRDVREPLHLRWQQFRELVPRYGLQEVRVVEIPAGPDRPQSAVDESKKAGIGALRNRQEKRKWTNRPT